MRSPKLAITLRYLITRESLNNLKYQFCVHETTIGKFIIPVCEAIFNILAPDYMKCPSTKKNGGIYSTKLITYANFLIAILQLMENTLE